MRFSDEAWHQNAALRAAIHKLPFNTELAAGTLSRERFRFYITQDALYLGQYARVLALAAAKGPEIATLQAFASSALGAVAVEQALHGRYLREFGVDPASILAAEPAPDCLAYTSFLIATAYQDPWEILVAALLPCFWIYWDIAQAITRDAAAENPYRAWIDTYADPHFGEAVGRVIGTADKAAAAAAPRVQDGMLGAFRRSAQYEWLFWDGAYNQRCWPAFD
ncbi:MAG: thiaminase II [Alphaproteobacteria bacterium]|nr:thiaminase II [Alphaproteobacteria bacterium]MBV9154096.1 thiaminase II [Alphaproteobacteria bacterium]MBV9585595.1 thiaminase II [Alphaproteobacteria bacterium]